MRRPMDMDANICVSVTFALATLFTFARFWARYITKVNLWLDDWFALAAWVSIPFIAKLLQILTVLRPLLWRGLLMS